MNKKVVGVSRYEMTKKWIARITINGKIKHLGYFDNLEEAVKARKDAEIKYGFVPLTPAPKLKHKDDLTQEMLKELLEYDPDTGIFTWIVNIGNIKSGSVAGSHHSEGYIHLSIGNKRYYAHRLAFLYMTGKFPEDGMEVDHINHKPSDNRFSNLRLATHQDNLKNRSINKDNTSGCVGVSLDNATNKWRAQIVIDGEIKYLGRFKNKDDAISVRKEAEIKFAFHNNHGTITKTN